MYKFSLLIFLTVVFVFTVTAQTYERAKIWDAEINALTEIDAKQTPPQNAVLFVGSSSIRGWKSLRKDFPKSAVINRGFGGSRIEDLNYYFDRVVAPYNPRMIVFYAGENDISAGFSPEKVLADFQKFHQMVRARLPQSKLVFISLKPSPARWQSADSFRKTNELVKVAIKRNKRAVFVDVWSAMLNEKGEPKEDLFLADKLHMNEKGYFIWREVLAKYLR